MVGAGLPENYERIMHFPEKRRRREGVFAKTAEVIRIVNQPDPARFPQRYWKDLDEKGNFSYMGMVLELEGNQIGNLGLVADGVNQYTDDMPDCFD